MSRYSSALYVGALVLGLFYAVILLPEPRKPDRSATPQPVAVVEEPIAAPQPVPVAEPIALLPLPPPAPLPPTQAVYTPPAAVTRTPTPKPAPVVAVRPFAIRPAPPAAASESDLYTADWFQKRLDALCRSIGPVTVSFGWRG